MFPFSLLTRFLLYSMESLGSIIAGVFRGVWILTGKFLLSPWGLLVPFTLLATLFLAVQIEKGPKEWAAQYAEELETCEDTQVSVLVDALVHLGDAGHPFLVQGMNSKREAVHLACRSAIEKELDAWEKSGDISERNRRYRLFTATLLEESSKLHPTAQIATFQFVRRVLRNLNVPDANSFISSPSVPGTEDSRMVVSNCERILERIEAARKTMLDPENGPASERRAETLARFSRNSIDPVLTASNGRPLADNLREESDSEYTLADYRQFDSLSVPRAERLVAYHESPLFREQRETPYRRPENNSLPPRRRNESGLGKNEMIASMSPDSSALPDPATPHQRIASRFETDGPGAGLKAETGIARNYLVRTRDGNSSESRNHDFLTEELRLFPLEEIPLLPSARLMRLLQHPDPKYVGEARKTLVGRDGFRDVHLKLAFKLYHPSPAVRKEIVSILPETTGIQPGVWLAELMKDPDADVRYRAASCLATASDPALQKIVIERGKRDTDSRIVDLADRLLENQGRRGTR